jgi:hypothetical protein
MPRWWFVLALVLLAIAVGVGGKALWIMPIFGIMTLVVMWLVAEFRSELDPMG